MNTRIVFALSVFLFLCIKVAASQDQVIDGRALAPISLEQIAAAIQPGSAVVMSDLHGSILHNQHQVQMLQALAGSLNNISVGLEFFETPFQSTVDQYTSGLIDEVSFLKAIHWSGYPFSNYREQALFPREHQGATLAINAPRALTGRIAKVGLLGLTEAERAQLPPDFKIGNTLYYKRFAEIMKGHAPPDAINRYFEAQSTWDDTMAWISANFLKANPTQILFIIVGDFHVVYGGGLPDRLTARGVESVVTISQVDLTDLDPFERDRALDPVTKYGRRADYIWVNEN